MENYFMAYGCARFHGAPEGVASKFARPYLTKLGQTPHSADVMVALFRSTDWAIKNLEAEELATADAS